MGTQHDNFIEIVEGQSKFELMSQLQDIGRIRSLAGRPNFMVKILHPHHSESVAQYSIALHINGLIAEDGSGNCWNIYGYIAAGYSWIKPGTANSFEGFYNTRTRKGHLVPRSS